MDATASGAEEGASEGAPEAWHSKSRGEKDDGEEAKRVINSGGSSAVERRAANGDW